MSKSNALPKPPRVILTKPVVWNLRRRRFSARLLHRTGRELQVGLHRLRAGRERQMRNGLPDGRQRQLRVEVVALLLLLVVVVDK